MVNVTLTLCSSVTVNPERTQRWRPMRLNETTARESAKKTHSLVNVLGKLILVVNHSIPVVFKNMS